MKSVKGIIQLYWGVIIVIVLTPLFLYGVLQIMPTHDDWFSMTTPDFRPFFIKEHFLFYGYHWRPFDTWIGYVAGRNPQLLYPTWNHCLVILGHLLCSIAIFKLLEKLGFNHIVKNIVTLFFFVMPATMATVTAVDSQNQVFALLVGIIAFLIYIKPKSTKYYLLVPLIFLATLCKENGLMWAFICPILAFGFDFIDKKTLKKDIIIGIGIVMVYALTIILLPKNIIIHPDYEPGILKVVANTIKFLFTSFVTVDYIYLLHAPNRNLLLAIVSLLLTLPFFFFIFIKKHRLLIEKKMMATIICLIIAVGPHLLTVFSMMHTYAGLVFVCIIIANTIQNYQQQSIKPLIISFILFLTASIAIDGHLIHESIKSGLVGKTMSQEAIEKTGKPVKSVYVIIIEDNYPKLSSFCVIPNEAFGWGRAAQYETDYQWPEEIRDTTIACSNNAKQNALELSSKILNNTEYNCVWIINHKDIDVVKK